jgi:outer membrane immunogenic protein
VAGTGGQTHWHNGWTVGAGWEYGVTRNWIVGLEYNYAAFVSQTYQLGGTAGSYTFDTKPRDIQWAVVRASYKFDAPTIARY